MTNFKVPPGETVEITLRRKRKKPARPRPSSTSEPKGIIPVESEPIRYVRRGESLITVYDLGARLRSVGGASAPGYVLPLGTHEAPERDDAKINEYVELQYQAELKAVPKTPNAPFNAFDFEESSEVQDPETWGELARALLGIHADDDDPFDPFEFTQANGSGRLLPNVLQLPFEQTLQVTLGAGGKSYKLNKDEADEWKKIGKEHDDEEWNPQNVSDETVFSEGLLKIKDKKPIDSIGVSAPWYYESFATGDEHFKVTALPSYAADAAEFNAKMPLRVFLVPQLFTVRREFHNAAHNFEVTFTDPPGTGTGSGFGTAMNGWSAMRLPVFPLLKPEGNWHLFLFPVAYMPDGLTPLPMEDQPEKAFLRALNVAIDRISVQQKHVIIANVSGQYTPAQFADTSTESYSLDDVAGLIDEAVEFVYDEAGASVELTSEANGAPQDIVGFVEQISRIPAGQLVGVVESGGGERFYFWRAEAVDRYRDNATFNIITALKE